MSIIWFTLIISSFYENYKVIFLSGIYSIILSIYFFYNKGQIDSVSYTDLIYLILLEIFIIIHMILNLKINKNARMEEKKNEELLKSILDSVNIVSWNFDVETKEFTFSEGINKISGYKKQDFKENINLWREVVHPKDRENIKKAIKDIYNGKSKVVETRIITKKGLEKWIQIRTIPNVDNYKKVIGINGVIIDITDRKYAEEKIKYMAYHDVLTELPNRIHFNNQFIKILSEVKQKNQKMAVLFIDLDKFKNINDTLGHNMGDLLLKQAANRLKKSLRETDFICRIGGDEFIILLKDITKEHVKKLAQRIVNTFKDPFILNKHILFVTPSIGISIYPDNGIDIETLIKNADDAMYLAKKKGKNNYQFFDSIKENI
ncbi:sensor domain-containing protein [Defluviitalea phaphyphila]|uniref:sensor domain-containing protein n=1 Tax=Defluviitalea phaphyphila TaxID=1473580 RepID=UPI001A9A587E|nr:sensor domain-containing diguanylate cyclase [Defluviitalea phaphyphila]